MTKFTGEGCNQNPFFSLCVFFCFLGLYCGHSPESCGECRDATEEGEGNDDEEEGKEGWHMVAGAATLSCQSGALCTPRHITYHAATPRVDLKIHRHVVTNDILNHL